MGTILEIAQPGLEGRRIIFADRFTVRNDVGFATNACPFSGRVEESNIDFGVRFEIVSLARFGVCVE